MSRAAECVLLRALCRTETSGTLRGTILDALATHDFAEPEHAEIFAALRDLQGVGRIATRERVESMLMRRGFPDLDLDVYFKALHGPEGLTEISTALRELGYRG